MGCDCRHGVGTRVPRLLGRFWSHAAAPPSGPIPPDPNRLRLVHRSAAAMPTPSCGSCGLSLLAPTNRARRIGRSASFTPLDLTAGVRRLSPHRFIDFASTVYLGPGVIRSPQPTLRHATTRSQESAEAASGQSNTRLRKNLRNIFCCYIFIHMSSCARRSSAISSSRATADRSCDHVVASIRGQSPM